VRLTTGGWIVHCIGIGLREAQQEIGPQLQSLAVANAAESRVRANAASGRIYPGGSLTVPDFGWQDSFNTNFFSAVRLTAALLPGMLERKSGAVVNISSGALTPPSGAMIHYSSAKAAMNAWSKTLATEAAPHAVRVNTVTPGNVVTHGADVVRADSTKVFGITLEIMTAAIPLRRMGVPQDLAEIVGFLVSDRAGWITGSNFICVRWTESNRINNHCGQTDSTLKARGFHYLADNRLLGDAIRGYLASLNSWVVGNSEAILSGLHE
jgi:NAD(P)-dependent dehydrogenase (short-subunit alcohol dehydrogenase family)